MSFRAWWSCSAFYLLSGNVCQMRWPTFWRKLRSQTKTAATYHGQVDARLAALP